MKIEKLREMTVNMRSVAKQLPMYRATNGDEDFHIAGIYLIRGADNIDKLLAVAEAVKEHGDADERCACDCYIGACPCQYHEIAREKMKKALEELERE